MRTRLLATVIVALIVFPATSFAQWTFAGYLGNAWTTSDTLTITNNGAATLVRLSEVEYASRAWNRPLYWGVRAGRTISHDGQWGIEFEYTHLKAYATPDQLVRVESTLDGRSLDLREPFRAVIERFQLSHGLNLLLVNVRWERRVNRRLSFVARGGIGPTLPHIEATIGGTSRDEYTWGRICGHAAAGIDLSLTRYLFVSGEVKQTYTRQRLAVGATRIDAPFNTTHVIVGVGLRLPARQR